MCIIYIHTHTHICVCIYIYIHMYNTNIQLVAYLYSVPQAPYEDHRRRVRAGVCGPALARRSSVKFSLLHCRLCVIRVLVSRQLSIIMLLVPLQIALSCETSRLLSSLFASGFSLEISVASSHGCSLLWVLVCYLLPRSVSRWPSPHPWHAGSL